MSRPTYFSYLCVSLALKATLVTCTTLSTWVLVGIFKVTHDYVYLGIASDAWIAAGPAFVLSVLLQISAWPELPNISRDIVWSIRKCYLDITQEYTLAKVEAKSQADSFFDALKYLGICPDTTAYEESITNLSKE